MKALFSCREISSLEFTGQSVLARVRPMQPTPSSVRAPNVSSTCGISESVSAALPTPEATTELISIIVG